MSTSRHHNKGQGMIPEFIAAFDANREHLLARFSKAPPCRYKDIVRAVIETVSGKDTRGAPDPERIHEIDDGHCQGTLVFVIASRRYQPSDYWYVFVDYGSCSGCDTLKHIREQPTANPAKDYLTLALHIVQGLRKMGGDQVVAAGTPPPVKRETVETVETVKAELRGGGAASHPVGTRRHTASAASAAREDASKEKRGIKKPAKTDRQRIAALERDVKKLLIQDGKLAGLLHYPESDLGGKADKGSIDPVTGDWA